MSKEVEIFDSMLRLLKYYMDKCNVLVEDPSATVDTIEGFPLSRIRNKLNAFDIIVRKKVDLWLLGLYDTWEKYKNRKLNCSREPLTKEEFTFLRRVCNEIELEYATQT